jgi:hypothetical protein
LGGTCRNPPAQGDPLLLQDAIQRRLADAELFADGRGRCACLGVQTGNLALLVGTEPAAPLALAGGLV